MQPLVNATIQLNNHATVLHEFGFPPLHFIVAIHCLLFLFLKYFFNAISQTHKRVGYNNFFPEAVATYS